MNVILLITVLLFGVSHGHYHGRVRSKQSGHNVYRDSNCSCTCDDISSLITIMRALDGKETDTVPVNNEINFNTEELVMKLVSALIEITRQALSQSKCHCPDSSHSSTSTHTTVTSDTNKGNPNLVPAYVGGPDYSEEGISSAYYLDVLKKKEIDKAIERDLSKQHLLNIGHSGESSSVTSQILKDLTKSIEYGKANEGNDDEHLTKKKHEVDVIKEHHSGSSASSSSTSEASTKSTTTTNTPISIAGSKTPIGSTSGEGLINVDLLNPNKPDNIAEVDLAHQNVVGVGLGNKNKL